MKNNRVHLNSSNGECGREKKDKRVIARSKRTARTRENDLLVEKPLQSTEDKMMWKLSLDSHISNPLPKIPFHLIYVVISTPSNQSLHHPTTQKHCQI
ncbi:hypothetical protein LINPERPRIM_LOCUS21460 [Linum perenne]